MRGFNRGILVLSISVILLGTTGAMLSGCTVRRVIVVKTHQKPAPRVEIRPQRPSKHYVWVPGYWKGKPGRWAWVPGHWKRQRGQQSVGKKNTKVTPIVVKGRQKPAPRVEIKPQRPSKHYVWVPGYWKGKPGRWTWVPGHWKNGGKQQSVDKKNKKVTPIDVDGQQKPAPKQEVRPQHPSAGHPSQQSVGKKKTKVTPSVVDSQQKPAPRVEVKPQRPSADRGGHQSVDKKKTKVGPIVVESRQKPPPEQEVKPERPSVEAVWVPGYWKGRPGHWAWVHGYWQERGRK